MKSINLTAKLYLPIFILAIILAGFLRFYKLGQVPPALNGDEAAFGSGALHLIENGPALYIDGQGGGGILASYIVALAFLILEPGKFALRFQASLIGTLTVITLFFASRALFLAEGKKQANLIAAFAALIMAVHTAHASITRIAFAITHLPFLQLLAVLFFALGYATKKRLYFAWGGLSLALVMYGYVAGIVLIPLFIAFLITAFISSKWWPDAIQPWFKDKKLRSGLLYFTFSFILFTLPLIFFYFNNRTQGSAGRLGEASFLNPAINHGDPLGALWHGVWGNYTAFGLAPIDWLLSGQFARLFATPLLLAVFIGILIALYNLKKLPYQFVLLWWGLTILPAALSPDMVPHASRAIGVYAPLSILAAITITHFILFIGEQLKTLKSRPLKSAVLWPVIKAIVSLLILLWGINSFIQTTWTWFDNYFNRWPYTEDALTAFDAYAIDLANDMLTLADPQTAYLLSRNTSAGSVSPNGTVNFLHKLYHNPSPQYWVTDNEETLAGDLSIAAKTATSFNVVWWKITKHTGADPKEVFDYYLEKYGTRSQVHEFSQYTIETYTLEKSGLDFEATETLTPSQVNFGHQLALIGYAFGNAGPGDHQAPLINAGQPLWARLRWQKLADHAQDLKVSLILKDNNGHRLAAVDKHLQNNILHQRSSHWELNSIADTYFLLLLPPYLMPDAYTLSLIVYQDESLTQLQQVNTYLTEYQLGRVQLAPSLEITEEVPETVLQSLQQPIGQLPTGLQLAVDVKTLPSQILPGQTLDFNLIWHTPNVLSQDYALTIDLNQNDGNLMLLPLAPIGGLDYPTHLWRPNEILSQWLTVAVPPGTNNTQQLTIKIWQNTQQIATWPITQLTVNDWPHKFTVPEDHHPLQATFGEEQIELVGYKLQVISPPKKEAGQLDLQLYWHPTTPINQPYISFVHLLNADGQLLDQVDHIPSSGAYPTTGWLPQEVITDQFSLTIPANVNPSSLTLLVGMYSPANFQRLSVTMPDGVDDKLTIPLEAP